MRALAALALVVGCIPSYATAQAPELVGTWRLVSITNEKTGTADESWGANPKGMLVLDNTGHFSQHQMRSDRPKFAGRGRLDGTPEDHKRTAEQTLSYFGTYTVDPSKSVITFRYDGSSWPNLEGTDAQRAFQLSGDRLKTKNPAAATGAPIALEWQKVQSR